jgi:hypothetical protein
VQLAAKGGGIAALECCPVQLARVDILGDGWGEHTGYIQTGGQSVSYPRAAYVNQGRLDDISL